MKRAPWMESCAALALVLLVVTGCPDSLTNPPAHPPPDTQAEDTPTSDTERSDAPPVDGIGDPPDVEPEICPGGPCPPAPAPPVVQGEPSAGHPHPTWLWTLPDDATTSQVRVDGGHWEDLAEGLSVYTAPEPLEAGAHLFEVRAVGEDDQASDPAGFETTIEYFERPGYWNGVARTLAISPLENTAAISAHNCYLAFIDPATSLEATRTMIQEAVAGGADLIELDIKDEAGLIRVDHDDDGSVDGALLADVLDLPELQEADQILYIEIKETDPTEAFVADLLDLLDARREHYARNGRPVVLRTFFNRLDNVAIARQFLDTGTYPLDEHYVRLSVLFGKDNFSKLSTYQETIAQLAADGYGMMEFNFRDHGLPGNVAYAHSLGLGVNVWTIPSAQGSVYVSALREEVDAITTDLSVTTARGMVQMENVLVYLNVGEQSVDADAVTWHQADGVTAQAGINEPGQPSGAAWATGEGLFGTVLEFEPDASEFLPLYDADCATDAGVLVTVAVRFGRLALEDGETMAILAKSDMAGWSLELHDPPGAGGPELRFAVFVDGLYRYASVPADWVLNEDDSFLIVGAYDGDGEVGLWVDNEAGPVVGEDASGGIENNDSLLLLGADPHGAAAPRYHFDGAIQQAAVLSWGPNSW